MSPRSILVNVATGPRRAAWAARVSLGPRALIALAAFGGCEPSPAEELRYVELLEAKAAVLESSRGPDCEPKLKAFEQQNGDELAKLQKRFRAGARLALDERFGPRVTAAEHQIRRGCRSDRERWLDLMEKRAQMLDRAGQDCTHKAGALRRFRETSDREMAELEQAMQRSGEGDRPFSGKDAETFALAKRSYVDAISACGENVQFRAAMQAPRP